MRKSTAAKGKPFNAKDYERPGISISEIEQIKEAFDLFDYEGKGTIDPAELGESLNALGYKSKNATLTNAVESISGSIDFAAFFDLLTARLSNKDSKDNLRRVFNLFDDEKAGFISIKNLRKVVKEVGDSIDDAELQEMIERADTDNDGLISEEQFYAIMTKRSAKI